MFHYFYHQLNLETTLLASFVTLPTAHFTDSNVDTWCLIQRSPRLPNTDNEWKGWARIRVESGEDSGHQDGTKVKGMVLPGSGQVSQKMQAQDQMIITPPTHTRFFFFPTETGYPDF